MGDQDGGSTGITIAELVALPHLRPRVLAGQSGLGRQVSWAHVTDIREPWDWYDPGDMVMTSGGILPHDAAGQAEFVERLAAAGYSGLVLGDNPTLPPITAALIEAADRVGLPVLLSGYSVSFGEFVRTVAASNERAEARSLRDTMRIQNEVRISMMSERSSTELLAAMGAIVDCALYTVDPVTWDQLLPRCEPAPEQWRGAIISALAERAGKLPLVIRLEAMGQQGLIVPVLVGRAACVLVVPRSQTAPRLAVLQHVAAAVALEMSLVEAGWERSRRTGSELLSDALQGHIAPKNMASSLSDRDLNPPWIAFAIEASIGSVDGLARQLSVRGVPYLLTGMGSIHVGLVGVGSSTLDLVRTYISDDDWRVGVSEPFSDLDALGDANRQARWALASIRPGAAGMAVYGQDHDSFLPPTVAESLRVVDRILGPLLEYDRDHGTDLVGTLRSYLENERSPKRTAQALFVHSQTINYRITRIEEVTGRSMRSTGDISELWFALRALALSESRPRTR